MVPERPQVEPCTPRSRRGHAASGSRCRRSRRPCRSRTFPRSGRDAAPVRRPHAQSFFVLQTKSLTSTVAGAFESIQFNPRARRQQGQGAGARRRPPLVSSVVPPGPGDRPRCRRVVRPGVPPAAPGPPGPQPAAVRRGRARPGPIDRTGSDRCRGPSDRLSGRRSATQPADQASVAGVLDSVSLLGRLEHLVVELDRRHGGACRDGRGCSPLTLGCRSSGDPPR